MPDFKGNKPDNLICEEQEIQIEKKGFYSAAFMIGFGECGEFGGWNGIGETIHLTYHDNSVEKTKIFFYDWWRGGGTFEFESETNCKLAISAKDNNGVNRYIYCCRINLNKKKELSGIHLPYNPCIHILAVTLCE